MTILQTLDMLCAALPAAVLADYDCHNGARMRVFDSTNEDMLQTVLDAAKDAGFRPFASNRLEDNIYETLLSDAALAHVYYCGAEKKLRVIVDPNTTVYSPSPEAFERRCASAVWQFETDHSFIDCGMCFILRCADNSFFLIDSGHFLQPNDHFRIYRFLRERTPAQEKVVISGWFFSHAHDDHVCQFMKFLHDGYDDVVIEKLYYNMTDPDGRDSGCWKESNKRIMRDFEREAEGSGLPIVKLHSGQRFFVRNLRIDVLCTHEDVYPNSLENYNDSSTVLMIEADGCRISIPGDAGAQESDVLTGRFTEKTLRCDVMQQAHHGHFGTSALYYKLSAAKVVLFPNTQIIFEQDLPVYEANRVAIDLADEYHVSSNGTVEVPLPYVPGTVKVLPDETFENFDRIHALWGYTYTDEYKQALFDEYLRRSGLPPMSEIDP
ncbi:MAG: hypothetical protein IJT44_12730 [Clostridia bacterium]|nr:hypothetical protein [Clostridia bacterium]